jgi:hypothetical protein
MRAVTVSVTVSVPGDYSDAEVRRMIERQLEDTKGDISNPEVRI